MDKVIYLPRSNSCHRPRSNRRPSHTALLNNHRSGKISRVSPIRTFCTRLTTVPRRCHPSSRTIPPRVEIRSWRPWIATILSIIITSNNNYSSNNHNSNSSKTSIPHPVRPRRRFHRPPTERSPRRRLCNLPDLPRWAPITLTPRSYRCNHSNPQPYPHPISRTSRTNREPIPITPPNNYLTLSPLPVHHLHRHLPPVNASHHRIRPRPLGGPYRYSPRCRSRARSRARPNRKGSWNLRLRSRLGRCLSVPGTRTGSIPRTRRRRMRSYRCNQAKRPSGS